MQDENVKATRQEERTQEVERPFEEMIDEAKEQVVEDFYKDALIKAANTIESLREQNVKLQEQQLTLRDEVALQCYVVLIQVNSEYPQAAKDSYNAADAFMRYREKGDEVEPIITH